MLLEMHLVAADSRENTKVGEKCRIRQLPNVQWFMVLLLYMIHTL